MPLTIKQARLIANGGAGYTQKECADALKINVNTYRRWEQEPGLMPMQKAKQFSELVNISLDALIF